MSKTQVDTIINDFIEDFVCYWHGRDLFSYSLEVKLSSFLSDIEISDLMGKKSQLLKKYSFIDSEHLFQLSKPLYLSIKYMGCRDYHNYLSGLSSEIGEYRAMLDIRDELKDELTEKYNNDPKVQTNVNNVFGSDNIYPRRQKDRLLHQLILRVDTLTNEYFNPYTDTEDRKTKGRFYTHHVAFILAKMDIFAPLKCEYKGKNRWLECSRIDCLHEGYKKIDMVNTCYDLYKNLYTGITTSKKGGNKIFIKKTLDNYYLAKTKIDECSCYTCECEQKKKCPTFYPCYPAVNRYKTYVRRFRNWTKERLN